jgi:phosphoserine phosphatase SerB
MFNQSFNNSIKERLAVFDLDNTLFNGRFIFRAAEEIGFIEDLNRAMSDNLDPVKRAEIIALMLKGISREKILTIADSIKLVDGACETIELLKQSGYFTGIITDSYDIVAELVKEKIGADFSIGIKLEFKGSTATGEIEIPPVYFKSEESQCSHNYCKGHAFVKAAKIKSISLENAIAVGDGENDICMIKAAGTGIAFCSQSDLLNSSAKVKVDEKNLLKILKFI